MTNSPAQRLAPETPSKPPPLQERLNRIRLDYALPLLVFAFSLCVTFILWQYALQDARQDLQSRFDSNVSEANARIEQRMKTYEQVLRGVDGLFAHADSVQRNEFRDYVARLKLEENYPGIHGVGFAQIVPKTEKARHITSIRRQGFPDYTITPGGERETYTAATNLEPFNKSNRRAFGYDMYTEPVRRAAMEQARDSDDAAISGKIMLLMESGDNPQASFQMYLPVYRHGAPHETLAERRANIIGWVFAPFRLSDLMNGILGKLNEEVDVEIYDGAEVSDRALLYDTDDNPGSRNKASFQAITPLNIGGHTWMVETRSQSSFESLLDRKRPGIIAYSGATISALMALLTLMLVHGRAQALRMAQVINRDLIKRENDLRYLFDNASEGIWVIGADLRTSKANHALLEILGIDEDKLIGKPVHDFIDAENAGITPGHTTKLQEPEKPRHSEVMLRRADGSMIYCQFNISSILDETGNSAGTFALVTDITARKQLELQKEQYLRFFMFSLDMMCIASPDGFFKKVNPAFVQTLGYSEREFLERPFIEFIIPEDRQATLDEVARQMHGNVTFNFENRYLHKNGSLRRLSWKAFMDDTDGLIYATAHDITVLMESKASVERISSFYKMLGDMNSANIHACDREGLFDAACHIAMESGLFRMVWIGLLDRESGDVLPVAHAGFVDGYLDHLNININHGERGKGPTATAIKSGKYVACNDFTNDPRMLPWREEALKRGYRASVIFPLYQNSRVIGTFNLYFHEAGLLTEDVIQLLESMVAEISFTLEFMAESLEREQMQREVRELSSFLETAREDERKHLARELHDELGQTMTALSFNLTWIEDNLDTQDNGVIGRILVMKNMLGHTLDTIRRISEGLRPGMLDDLGLAASIENYVTEFSERTGILCKLSVSPLTAGVGDAVQTTLFRVIQESLTNVARHSGADLVSIQLHELKDDILLVVQDNGRGLPPAPDTDRKAFGLMGMRERVRMLGGALNIFSEHSAGVRIEASIPKHLKERTQ